MVLSFPASPDTLMFPRLSGVGLLDDLGYPDGWEPGKLKCCAAGAHKSSSYLDDLAPGGVRAAPDFA
jgi:hypothetical protein